MVVKIDLTETKTPPPKPPEASKTSQRRPQKALTTIFGSKKRANEAQGSSKTKLEAPFGRSRGPREPPRDPQEPPRGAQDSPKTYLKPSSDRKCRFFKNRAPAEVKLGFLRVGEPAWELKIDPKRPRKNKKQKNRTKKNGKTRIEGHH